MVTYLDSSTVLTQLQTWRLLDIIAEHAGRVAVAAFPYIYRRDTNACLDALRSGLPIAVDGLSVKQARKLFGA
jgi:hypothetical protein